MLHCNGHDHYRDTLNEHMTIAITALSIRSIRNGPSCPGLPGAPSLVHYESICVWSHLTRAPTALASIILPLIRLGPAPDERLPRLVANTGTCVNSIDWTNLVDMCARATIDGGQLPARVTVRNRGVSGREARVWPCVVDL